MKKRAQRRKLTLNRETLHTLNEGVWFDQVVAGVLSGAVRPGLRDCIPEL